MKKYVFYGVGIFGLLALIYFGIGIWFFTSQIKFHNNGYLFEKGKLETLNSFTYNSGNFNGILFKIYSPVVGIYISMDRKVVPKSNSQWNTFSKYFENLKVIDPKLILNEYQFLFFGNGKIFNVSIIGPNNIRGSCVLGFEEG